MKKKKSKVVWYIEVVVCVILVSLMVLVSMNIWQGHSHSEPWERLIRSMSHRLSECATAEEALQSLERGCNVDLGLYKVSESYPSSVEGVLVMVMINAPSGASPQYSVLVLHPAPKQSDMHFRRRGVNGDVKKKAFAVRYIDWNPDE